ncbi:MAG TPA: TPM domain-containing protein [Thermoanaerobaculia bacterium]|nr:TPM domain-containing protein [Thermoanaerobaculia bacterium]
MILTRRGLYRAIDRERVRAAIAAAEAKTSGEIRVTIARFFWGDVRRVAERAFDRLGMRNTRERNGVLLFVVPSRRRFVVLGDEGIHARVPPGFWDEVAAALSSHFKKGAFTEGIVAALENLGDQLGTHFPRREDDVNELSDEVDFPA